MVLLPCGKRAGERDGGICLMPDASLMPALTGIDCSLEAPLGFLDELELHREWEFVARTLTAGSPAPSAATLRWQATFRSLEISIWSSATQGTPLKGLLSDKSSRKSLLGVCAERSVLIEYLNLAFRFDD